MSQYKTPDVYVREKSILPPSVAEVATAIPAFIGYSTKIEDINGESIVQKPIRIKSMIEFEANFGGAYQESFMLKSKNDTNTAFKVISLDAGGAEVNGAPAAQYFLYQAVSHFFANGGGACYVVAVGEAGNGLSKADFETAVAGLNKVDEVTLISTPESIGLGAVDHYSVQNKSLAHAESRMDRFALVDVQMQMVKTATGDFDIATDSTMLRSSITAGLQYGASYYPYLQTTVARSYNESNVNVYIDDGTGTDTFNIVSMADLGDDAAVDYNAQTYNLVKAELGKNYLVLPPSPAVAGAIAKTDKDRGVWKAPANVALSQVLAPKVAIDNDDQKNLNVDATSGKSINAIRSFVGKGTLVWGARTLAGNDNEWRYVSVRRLFNTVEESIQKATHFAVFEPNTPFTWLKLKTMIESYLENLWRAGAFFGETPEQAFFVNVGLGQTMTEDDINNGIMNIEIGLAAVRPAEFIVLTFSHKSIEG
ncbi:phage tail sheath family protein [Pseudoalteromonas sp. MMG013]|uniref:phage tail sheath family protein n=1 Tax=Pseudoalteromonas sp. MMG013 TaxID=2822687 RepID=UPI001B37C467|nr:phage tail sheath C-terminal domain-containing protein [Pseudoalteromonas sp. MMG013]MBQ4863485.1 phage tail sheath family protein [Pseudoalteromonas sp. MMG013]